MRRSGLRLAAVVVAGLLAGKAGQAALETTGTGTIEGKVVSAYARFEIVAGTLQITLTNTGNSAAYAMAHVLTDVSFQMEGVDPEEDYFWTERPLSVVVAPGSYLSYDTGGSEPAGFDVSPEWGLARNVMLADPLGQSLGPFDFTVTATSPLNEQSASPFVLSSDLGGAHGLDGGDFGLINQESRNSDGIGAKDIIVDSVVITLVPLGDPLVDADLNRITAVTYSFGSDHVGIVGIEDAVIPEPSSLAVWCLLAPLAVVVRQWRRKR